MTKKALNFSDLSKKQLCYLKEIYVQEKVNNMSNEDLKKFASEIISHQVQETIGREEEMEARKEMSDYFGEKFETVILEVQKKIHENDYKKPYENEEDNQTKRIEYLSKHNNNEVKKDMWDD